MIHIPTSLESRFKNRLAVCFAMVIGCWSWFGNPARCLGNNGPENVVVVVNASSPASLAVANHYIHLRGIPRQNVIYLNITNPNEQVKHPYFSGRILKPVLDTLVERDLTGHINCITYSSDFPTVVNIQPHRKLFEEKIKSGQGQMYRGFGSINSLTYFARSYMADDPSYLLLDANWYMSGTVENLFKRPFLGDTQAEYQKALDAYSAKEFASAVEGLQELASKHPGQVAVRYNLARALARNDQSDQAIEELVRAVRLGWCYRSYTREDPAFESLRDNALFQAIVEKIDDQPFEYLPSRGFRSGIAWGPNGWPNNSLDQGKPLMLSTVLAVTRNRGTTLQEALDNLSRSAAADSTFPDGTFYFCKTSDIRSKVRGIQFESTIEELRRIGMRGEVFNGKMPMNKDDVVGVALGTAKFDWSKSGSRLVPGAIGDNFTSYGGVMRTKNAYQTPLSELIRAGAAGSSGTVCEPFAVPYKFPHTRIYAHYARGCTLAESFYQSVHGPFQLLIVGDPLCRPWARPPKFTVVGLDEGSTVSGEAEFNIQIANDSPRISRFEMYLDGKRIGQADRLQGPVQLDTTQYSDGYHEIRIVALDATPIQTSASAAVGVVFDNNGRQVAIESDKSVISESQSVTLKCSSNSGEKIQIVHNSRILGELPGNSGTLKVPGLKFGVGKVKLFAEVHDGDQVITSRPLELEIK